MDEQNERPTLDPDLQERYDDFVARGLGEGMKTVFALIMDVRELRKNAAIAHQENAAIQAQRIGT